MRKRTKDTSPECDAPRKRGTNSSQPASVTIEPGEVLTDIRGKGWRLGKVIGVGGFGEIFLVSDDLKQDVVGDECEYVAKIESHSNGPLFVERNCYLRIAKREMITDWMEKQGLKQLGMPHYVASGSHVINGLKYRFLIIPRYKTDLESIIQERRKLNVKTVLTISMQLLDVLQYIHCKGFIHADIKASNILVTYKDDPTQKSPEIVLKRHLCRAGPVHGPIRSCRFAKSVVPRTLRSNHTLHVVEEKVEQIEEKLVNDQIYLLDYGLASKYTYASGQHREDCEDERKAHAGTMLFCSVDAHKGGQSRRSDLETLGYNIIYWLTGHLPWENNLDDPEIVQKKKERCITQLQPFLTFCFGNYPKFLYKYFKHLQSLDFKAEPDYHYCRKLFMNAVREFGYKSDDRFDFDNSEGWGHKANKCNLENKDRKQMVYVINRSPLKSNLPIKPVLRKKNKICMLNWSRILMFNPEYLLKKGKRERKNTESSEGAASLSNLDIYDLNPTAAMMDIFNNYMEKVNSSNGSSPRHKVESLSGDTDGYTKPMLEIHNRILEQKMLELRKNYEKKSSNSKKQVKRLGRGTKKKVYNLRG